ncbi:hypothetical protein [Hymenobacter yonginensis]|uniref:Lipocalin-like domain-containing protein n=1 Tax=Hymenobacter yonginensis TaxID=748197 RepID=A0ABY7PJZ3_9BACT|nr:hypothetical protein [Hymenobacter yonginensis]WBO82987.1 hypothetical protein O9Z63_11415 [Hymenobacter yonginensis]
MLIDHLPTHSVLGCLLLLLVLFTGACKKSTPEPVVPVAVTNGQLAGQWRLFEQRFRYYNPRNELQSDEVAASPQPGSTYDMIFNDSTARYRQYIGTRAVYDSAFAYTRQNLIIKINDGLFRELKIIELTDQRLTFEHRDGRPNGYYYITEDRYKRF